MAGLEEAKLEPNDEARQKIHSSHKKKRLIDPAAPKAPPNCFLLYLKDHREAVKSWNGSWVPELSSEMGRRWKMLSREDRIHYDHIFQEKMKEYEIAKSNL